MLKNVYFLFMMIILLITSKSYAQFCPDSTKQYKFAYNGHTYYVVKQLDGYTDAQSCAVELGGHLVYIDDQAEQDTIYNAISAAGVSPTYTTVANGGGIAYVWIGATDGQTEGTWKWGYNGTTFWMGEGAAGSGGGSVVGGAYHNWGGKSSGTIQEPDDFGSGQDAAAIGLASWPSGSPTPLGMAGEWNDIPQFSTIYFVVEVDSLVLSINNNAQFVPKIYPNPAHDIIHVEVPGNNGKKLHIQLVNMMGQTLKETTAEGVKVPVNIRGLAPGTYFLQLKNEEGYSAREIILIH